jgi:hypothetical protein
MQNETNEPMKTDIENGQWAASISEAAKITSTSRQSLSAYKRDGCPAFKSNGKVNLVELAAWTEAHGKRTAPETDEIRVERLRILRATATRIERENEEKADLLVLRSEAVWHIRAGMMTTFNELDRIFCNELPPALCGLDAVKIQTRCKAAIEQLRTTLKEKYTLQKKT